MIIKQAIGKQFGWVVNETEYLVSESVKLKIVKQDGNIQYTLGENGETLKTNYDFIVDAEFESTSVEVKDFFSKIEVNTKQYQLIFYDENGKWNGNCYISGYEAINGKYWIQFVPCENCNFVFTPLGSGSSSITFKDIGGNATDNTSLNGELNKKLDLEKTEEQQVKGPIDFVERPKYQGTSLPIFNDLQKFLDKNEMLDQTINPFCNFVNGAGQDGWTFVTSNELDAYLTVQSALFEFGRLSSQATNAWNSLNNFNNNTRFYRALSIYGPNGNLFLDDNATGRMLKTPDGTDVKSITNVEFVKAQVNNIGETISNEEAQKISTKGLSTSANLPSGDIMVKSDADLGNPWVLVKGRRAIRTGQITLTNKYNNTDETRIGNKLYGSIFSTVPELNDVKMEVYWYWDVNAPVMLVSSKGSESNNSFPIRFDDPTYSNVDTTLIIGLGNNNNAVEGRFEQGFRGYYKRSNLTYQWTQTGSYIQVVKGVNVGDDYIALSGCGIGRDNDVYAVVPNAQGPTDFAPQPYAINYAVFEKSKVI